MTTPDAFPLEPTPIRVPDEVLDDLRARLSLTRPPLDERNADWSYGVPDSYVRELVAYWRDGYDWRQAEAAINAYEHYQVSVAGVPWRCVRRWKDATRQDERRMKRWHHHALLCPVCRKAGVSS